MISLFDKYAYYIAIIIAMSFFIIIFLSNKATIFYKNRKIIAITTGVIQLSVTIIFTIIALTRGAYHHMLLTDMCPYIATVSAVFFIINNDKLLKASMPWMLIGSLLTMTGASPDLEKISVGLGLISFFRHWLMLFMGILAFMWIKKYTKLDLLFTLIIPAVLIIWILLVGYIPWKVTGDIKWAVFSTALLKPSLTENIVHYNGYTETDADYSFLGDLGWPYPLATIGFYLVAIILCYSIIALNIKIRDKIYKIAIR